MSQSVVAEPKPELPTGGELERLLTAPAAVPASSMPAVATVRTGRLVALDEPSRPLIVYDGCPQGIRAATSVDLSVADVGRQVVIAFDGGNEALPIVTGVIRQPGDEALRSAPIEVSADGRRVTITASDRLVLRCGHSTVSLDAAGKIVIQGEYVTSRSTGVLRLKGGSVQIN